MPVGSRQATKSHRRPLRRLLMQVCDSPERVAFWISSGDVLLLFTDGIDETFDPTGKVKFGIPRVQALVHAHRHLPAAEIVEVVFGEVLKYCYPEVPHDDLTLVVVKVL